MGINRNTGISQQYQTTNQYTYKQNNRFKPINRNTGISQQYQNSVNPGFQQNIYKNSELSKKVTNDFRMRGYKVKIDGSHITLKGLKPNNVNWKKVFKKDYFTIYPESYEIEFVIEDCNIINCK